MEKQLSLDYWKDPKFSKEIYYTEPLIGSMRGRHWVSKSYIFSIPIRYITNFLFLENIFIKKIIDHNKKGVSLGTILSEKIKTEDGLREIVSLVKTVPEKIQWEWRYITLTLEADYRKFAKIPSILNYSKFFEMIKLIHLRPKGDNVMSKIFKGEEKRTYKFSEKTISELYSNYPKFLTKLIEVDRHLNVDIYGLYEYNKSWFNMYLGQEIGLIPK